MLGFLKKLLSSSSEAHLSTSAAFTTKVCYACNAVIPLETERCEYCETAQKKDDSTCGAGELSASKAQANFNSARNKAKKVGSFYYIWRSSRDGAVCERCRANDGKKFSWDAEPKGGHAGAKARCRCSPEAIVPGSPPQNIGKSRWEKDEEAYGKQRQQDAEFFFGMVRTMLADKVEEDRLHLRYFWATYYVLLDDDVKKPVVALQWNQPDARYAIFFAKPEQNVKDGGSRRALLQNLEDIQKHEEKICESLKKY